MGGLWIPFLLLLSPFLPHLCSYVPPVLYTLVVSPPFSEINGGSVLVTGSGKGIGKDIALFLDAKGFKVYAGVRNEKQAEDLKKVSKSIVPVLLDIDNDKQIEEVFNKILTPSEKFVAIVNNAAIFVPAPFEALSAKQIRDNYNTNLASSAVMVNKFLPVLRKNKGRVVMISSLAEEVPMPFMGVYPSSKMGLSGLCETLRRELKPYGVHFANVEPGVVLTDMSAKLGDAQFWRENIDPSKDIEDLEKTYGPYYSESNQKYLHDLMFDSPMKAQVVSEAVYHAISSSTPRPEYLLGSHEIVIKFLRNLPTWFQDLYISKMFWPGPHVTIED